MKRLFCVLLTLAMLFTSPALAMDKERFLNEPDNAEMAGSIIYGLNEMMMRAGTGRVDGLMLMIYSTIAVDRVDYPLLVMMFGADSFEGTAAQIETDHAVYTIMSTGKLSSLGVITFSGMSNILTTPEMAEVYRAIVKSSAVKITFMNKGQKYDFKLTDAQKHQLSVVVAEFDQEIALYLDPAMPEYCEKLAELYKLAGPTIAVSRK